MAHAMGLFAKHGLNYLPGPKLGDGGPTRVQAVATGATEVATSDLVATFGGIYSGADLRVLMVLTPYHGEEIWAQDKYKTLQAAEGQPWGIEDISGGQRFVAQMTIEGMGLKPDDFHFVAIPGADSARLQALDAGRTEITNLSPMGAALAEAKGFTKHIHALISETAKYTPQIPLIVVIAKESWIKSHEQAATRYVETMLDAGRQWENNADSWINPAEQIFKGHLTKAQLHQVWQEFHDGGAFTVNGGVNFAATQKVLNLFFKLRHESPNEYLSKPSDVYDTGPLQAALDKMGVVPGTPSLPDNPDWYHKGHG
jgi:ABC-type nitrate/sulfonate/bicarbonate transport system substrate-binding protein